MSFRTLGRSGLKVSVAGLGTNNFGQRIPLEKAREVIDAALDHGINLFDTADVYGGRGGFRLAAIRCWARVRGGNRVVLATAVTGKFDVEARNYFIAQLCHRGGGRQFEAAADGLDRSVSDPPA